LRNTGLPFEIQVSQSFNDGNKDFEWRHGAVVTAKEEGLWTPCRRVTEEDVRHLQSRFEVFRCTAKVEHLQDVQPCPTHMSQWIRDCAALHDARPAMGPVLPVQSAGGEVVDMDVLAFEACLPSAAVAELQQELVELGAVHVRELSAAEWTSLRAWSKLKVLEQRRVMRWLQ
jgi:hypothetical protein